MSLALVLVSSACSSGTDKAGGEADKQSVLLTLANPDPDPDSLDSPDFVSAVERLSGNSIRIDVEFGRHSDAGGEHAEERAVDDVRRGEVDLAVIPTRVWDRLDVKSFRALLAPFLVDSLALEQRVATSRLADRMLDGVEGLGLVGVALIPGELRYPLGLTRPFVGRADYTRASFGVESTPVATATFRALGASPAPYTTRTFSGLDGAEVGIVTTPSNRFGNTAGTLTANVVFWPRALTVVMNRHAFEALTPGQQEVLRRSGLHASREIVERIRHDTETWLSTICRRSSFDLVRASESEKAALRRAVEPVYAELERNPLTRELIAEIRALRGEGRAFPTDTARCPVRGEVAKADAAPLRGRWEATLTREELRESGASPGLVHALSGSWTIGFADGRFDFRRAEGGRGTGTYTVAGHTLRFVFDHGVGVIRGEAFESTWSVYRDKLSFSPIPGRAKMAGLDVEPFTRVH